MIEDQLRERLHRVDELTPPPAPDFAGQAMRAADAAARQQDDLRDGVREDLEDGPGDGVGAVVPLEPRDDLRDARRRRSGKVLLGAAAAIAIGALAVTGLPHLGGTSSSTSGSAVAGAAAPEDARGETPATGPGSDLPTKEGEGSTTLPTPAASGPVAFYDAAECAGTLTTVRSALAGLQQDGLPVVSAACNAQGVVVVRVSTALTPEQRSILTTRYGTRVSVAGLDGTPLP